MTLEELDPVIWTRGDVWRDLRGDITSAGVATVVTLHGAARILNWRDRWQVRLPLADGHRMAWDGLRHDLSHLWSLPHAV